MNPIPSAADQLSRRAGGVMGVTELTVVLGISAMAALIIYWVVGRASS